MDTYPKQIILPYSGKTATIERRLKVRDSRIADRMVGRNADPMQKSCAVLAQVISIDGARVVMEDLDDMDLEDFNVLLRAIGFARENEEGPEKNSQTPLPSPNLSNGGSQRLS